MAPADLRRARVVITDAMLLRKVRGGPILPLSRLSAQPQAFPLAHFLTCSEETRRRVADAIELGVAHVEPIPLMEAVVAHLKGVYSEASGGPPLTSDPESDPNMIGLAQASFEYNIPRSLLSKGAAKSHGASGFLRSVKKGHKRYFWKKDLIPLARSRQAYRGKR